jgi:hypothetical protein
MASEQFRFILTATDDEPPSFAYAVAHAEETGHGCAICVAVVSYDEAGKQIGIDLPGDAPPPAGLEVMVLDEHRRRYAPCADAVRALVDTRRARWCLPPSAPPPAAITVSFGFEWKGAMVSEERRALPAGPTPLPASAIVRRW